MVSSLGFLFTLYIPILELKNLTVWKCQQIQTKSLSLAKDQERESLIRQNLNPERKRKEDKGSKIPEEIMAEKFPKLA